MPASRAGSRGRAYSGAAACRSLWAGKPPVAALPPVACPRSPRAGGSLFNAPPVTAPARTGQAVLLAPGILLPRKDHSKGRA
jgi:hypothetical protein